MKFFAEFPRKLDSIARISGAINSSRHCRRGANFKSKVVPVVTNFVGRAERQRQAQKRLSVLESGHRIRISSAGIGRITGDAVQHPESGAAVESHDAFGVGGRLARRSVR